MSIFLEQILHLHIQGAGDDLKRSDAARRECFILPGAINCLWRKPGPLDELCDSKPFLPEKIIYAAANHAPFLSFGLIRNIRVLVLKHQRNSRHVIRNIVVFFRNRRLSKPQT